MKEEIFKIHGVPYTQLDQFEGWDMTDFARHLEGLGIGIDTAVDRTPLRGCHPHTKKPGYIRPLPRPGIPETYPKDIEIIERTNL